MTPTITMNEENMMDDKSPQTVRSESAFSGMYDEVTVIFDAKGRISVPKRVHSHEEFASAVLKLYDASNQFGQSVPFGELLKRAYYLLGWLVGDTVKQFSSKSQRARIGIGLCKKREENLALGEYVSECVRMLGIPSHRIADQPRTAKEPHGAYRWLSSYTLVASWLKMACLGLARGELTSYVPVRMDWLLSAPAVFRLWFLRGLADSDGTVNFRNKSVNIVTSPNTGLVRKLLESLGCHTTAGVSKGVGVVTISGGEAARIQIFNPEVMTHRRKRLEKLCNATTYERHWPDWLEARVKGLIGEGLDARAIRDLLLAKDNVYVKLKTLKRKRRLYQG